jgi:DNA-binding MarR family transcriptional regulator
MSIAALDTVIHAPNRLRICAFLTPRDEAEFKVLRATFGISDSVLSKHLSRLEAAGYIRLRKAAVDGRVRTWVSLTAEGRQAFAAHLLALQQVVALASGKVAAG